MPTLVGTRLSCAQAPHTQPHRGNARRDRAPCPARPWLFFSLTIQWVRASARKLRRLPLAASQTLCLPHLSVGKLRFPTVWVMAAPVLSALRGAVVFVFFPPFFSSSKKRPEDENPLSVVLGTEAQIRLGDFVRGRDPAPPVIGPHRDSHGQAEIVIVFIFSPLGPGQLSLVNSIAISAISRAASLLSVVGPWPKSGAGPLPECYVGGYLRQPGRLFFPAESPVEHAVRRHWLSLGDENIPGKLPTFFFCSNKTPTTSQLEYMNTCSLSPGGRPHHWPEGIRSLLSSHTACTKLGKRYFPQYDTQILSFRVLV